MTTELYKKYRPQNFNDVVGQTAAVQMLKDMGKRGAVPHCLLFVGASGCGKTTLARILRVKLGCGDADFVELNASAERGIDMVRDVQSRMGLAPISGKCRVWLVDECHQLTAAAQDALLKTLEDTPAHVYFFLATTDRAKLKKTIVTRCTEIAVSPMSDTDLHGLCRRVLMDEGTSENVSTDVLDKLVSIADGSARKALVLLHAVMGLPNEAQQMHALLENDAQAAGIDLARLLMSPKLEWSACAKVLSALDKVDAEDVRRLVLGYCRKVLLGGGKAAGRAAEIIGVFQYNFYDTGMAGLAKACWDLAGGQ